jgi:ankyrin repeat protein
MKPGCALSLLVWAAAGGAYWYLIHSYFQPPLQWMVPAAAGLLMAVAVGALQNAMTAAGDAVRLGQQSQFSGVVEPPKDGEVVTIAGHIRAAGSSLRAPFSGKPAVLYSYEIQHYGRQADGDTGVVKDYSGFALSPCAIDSPRGSIRLLGFPMLEGFPKELLASDVARTNAASYLGSTQFADMGGFQVRAMVRELKELMTDDDGQVRKDWKMTDETDISEKSLYEQIVSPGEQVCIIGRYSAEKRGVVPDVAHGNALRLVQGDARAASGSAWGKVVSNLVGFAVVALLVNGGVYTIAKKMSGRTPFAITVPKSAKEVRQDKEAYERAVRDGDIAAMDKLVGGGVAVDTPNDEGTSPLAYAPDGPTAQWLIDRGAKVNAVNHKGQTPLMDQASAGNAAAVAALIKAGANLEAKNPEYKSTALMQALDNEKSDVAELLRKAGAHDDTVTKTNGKPVTEASEPVRVCLQWLDAIHKQDAATLKKISTFDKLEGIDFKIWIGARPERVEKVTGFAGDDTATVSLRGPVPGGAYFCTWTYQLVRRDGVWKITNERWEK